MSCTEVPGAEVIEAGFGVSFFTDESPLNIDIAPKDQNQLSTLLSGASSRFGSSYELGLCCNCKRRQRTADRQLHVEDSSK